MTAPVRIAVVGAGNRGSAYAQWAVNGSGRAEIVALAELNAKRRTNFAARYQLEASHVFEDWQALAQAEKSADAVFIATLDDDHVGPATTFAGLGYHILLEKPLAPSPAECREIIDAIDRSGVIFAVCHVLRYAPYTQLVKKIVDSGRLGQLLSVHHLEPVGYWHQAHSYVRGNWRNDTTSSFMLLTKSCHDIDWIQHVVGKPIRRVSSFGSLSHFTPEHRPEGAADRCWECTVEARCPYSAVRLYQGLLDKGHHDWPLSAVIDRFTPEALRDALRTGPYGKCVYDCDNSVVDHQVVAMEFDGGATAVFTMIGPSQGGHRITRIFGSHAELRCDGVSVEVHDFLTGQTEVFDAGSFGDATAAGGHGGGDAKLIDAFVSAVAGGDPDAVLSGTKETLTSHLAVFAAERARLTRQVLTLTD